MIITEGNKKTYGYYYPVEKEIQLINMVKSGNTDTAGKIIEDILDINNNNYLLTDRMFELLKLDMACTMTKIVCDLFKESAHHHVEKYMTIENITECKNSEDLKQIIKKVASDIVEHSEYISKNNLIGEITQYVEENYIIPNLSVSVISEHFNVHISYLSTSFKRQMGLGLAEYIQSVRINKAKEILKTSNKKIEEVANAVGYFSLHTFVRIFKNSEGVTPTRYRHNLESH